jgi:transposase InsO family protein
MDIHKNARSCPSSRALLIDRVQRQGWTVTAAAEAAGMSRRRSSEWLRRGRSGESTNDRSSAARKIHRIDEHKREQILELRRQRMTMRQIAKIVCVSLSTVSRVCSVGGLSRLTGIDPPPAVVRYERERAGELLHIDIKKLGRIGCVGHRITNDRTVRARNVGWEFVHVAIDDASRVGYVEILEDECADTAVGFLRRAVEWFAAHGVRIERVMSDNGVAYRSHAFAAVCRVLDVKHKRTKPYTPRTNGKAERFIQTLLREWAYRFTYPSSHERREMLPRYLHVYNHHRGHTALGSQPPITRLLGNNALKRDT